MIATVLLSLVLAHSAGSMPRPTIYELPRAERATGRAVICMGDERLMSLARHWGEHRGAVGMWLLQEHMIVMAKSLCSELAHPKKDTWSGGSNHQGLPPPPEPFDVLANAIFVLGHEAAHARQQELDIPFSEHQADCWSKSGFQTLKQRLRIRMHVTFAMTRIPLRCP